MEGYALHIGYPLSTQQGNKLTRAKAKLRAAKQATRAHTTRVGAVARTRRGKGAGAGLMIMVPIDTLKMLRMRAAETGSTVRALVLESLMKCGYAVPSDELIDRRRHGRKLGPKKPPSVRGSSRRRKAY